MRYWKNISLSGNSCQHRPATAHRSARVYTSQQSVTNVVNKYQNPVCGRREV